MEMVLTDELGRRLRSFLFDFSVEETTDLETQMKKIKKSHNKRWPELLSKHTHKINWNKNNYPVLLSHVLKHLDKKAVLQTIGYQHTSKVPQCSLGEA